MNCNENFDKIVSNVPYSICEPLMNKLIKMNFKFSVSYKESNDKDAKIIFGIASDPTLKKDEVKVTVIATGFPTGFSTRSGSSQDDLEDSKYDASLIKHDTSVLKKEHVKEANDTIDQTTSHLPKEENRIDNGVTAMDTDTKEEDKKSKDAGKKPVFKFDDDEDDDWEALPPFLRRKK